MPEPSSVGETYESIAARAKRNRKWRAHALADDLGVSEEIILGWLHTCQERGLDIGMPRENRDAK